MFKFILLFLISCPVMADEWTTADTYREAIYLTIDTMDWAQTREITRSPQIWGESNPILGQHPSIGSVNTWFISAGIAHYYISRALPSPYRAIWQYVSISFETQTVVHNIHGGFSIKF